MVLSSLVEAPVLQDRRPIYVRLGRCPLAMADVGHIVAQVIAVVGAPLATAKALAAFRLGHDRTGRSGMG